MKKTILILLTLVMAVSLVSPAAFAADRTFVMGIDPEYPPFSYMGDDGEYTGFDVEVCKAVKPCAIISAGSLKSSASTGMRSWYSSTPWSATVYGPA